MDAAPEKISYFKRNLLQFANNLLSKLSQKVENLESDFSNGVNFILLIGQVSGFFVPLHHYHQNPQNSEEKLENVNLALELAEESGFQSRNLPTEIVQGNWKPIMRLLFHLYKMHYSNST